jgi:uncharacterized surface protein with fasciclin (FAS1) repeats
VVQEQIGSDTLFTRADLMSLAGDVIQVDAAARTIDGASVIDPDIAADKAVVHVVSSVLMTSA